MQSAIERNHDERDGSGILKIESNDEKAKMKYFRRNVSSDKTEWEQFQRKKHYSLKKMTVNDTEYERKTNVKFFKNQKSCLKSSRELNFVWGKITDKVMKVLVSQIGSYLKGVQRLNIGFCFMALFEQSNSDLTEAGVRAFSRLLGRSFSQLQELKLIPRIERITKEGEDLLFKTIGNSFGKLKKLTLDLARKGKKNLDDLSKEHVFKLGRIIRNNPKFESLQLDLSERKITDEKLEMLMSRINENLTQLQGFELKLCRCKDISDNGMTILTNAMKSLEHLQKLNLDFLFCDKISEDGVAVLSTGIPALPQLKTLKLRFERTNKISNEALEILTTGVQNRNHLKVLEQEFRLNTKLKGYSYRSDDNSDKLLEDMTESYAFAASFKKLKADYAGFNQMSNRAVAALANGIGSLMQLQVLELYFNKWDVSNEGIAALTNALRNLTLLRTLYLDFSSCEKISDDDITRLGNAINNLRRMEDLKLNFSQLNQISINGVTVLANAIGQLEQLQALHLKFYSCKAISDDSVIILANNIGKSEQLKRLALDLEECPKISDLGFVALADSVGNLKQLESLKLFFQNSPGIRDYGIGILANQLRKNRDSLRMKEFYYRFPSCSLTQRGWDVLVGLQKELVGMN